MADSILSQLESRLRDYEDRIAEYEHEREVYRAQIAEYEREHEVGFQKLANLPLKRLRELEKEEL
jgi:hypothetical protein